LQHRNPWIHLKPNPATVCAVVLITAMIAPTCLLADTSCATPAGVVACSKGPVRKQVTLPAPAAAPSRAEAAKLRQDQVTTQRQKQVGGQRQELLKQRQDRVTKQRAGIRGGLNSKNLKSLSGSQASTN
jgi:hypothetical protein